MRARRLAAAATVAALLPGAAPTSRLEVTVGNLRSAQGLLRLCITADPDNFPGCVDDAQAITRSVPVAETAIVFDGVASGRYAIAVIHDANANGRLDTLVGIPREGFGFSRNPGTLGRPSFAAARFPVEGDVVKQQVRMRYLL